MKHKFVLTVVLGTRNRVETLKLCLNSLLDKISVPYGIVVVDAGSDDGTQDYVRSLKRPEITLVEDKACLGQAQSLNRVFRTLDTEYVCWISDDNEVTSSSLDTAVEILRLEPGIGMVTLKVKDVCGRKSHFPYIGRVLGTGAILATQGMLPYGLFAKVGFFSEEYVDYGIDPDLTMKILLAGYRVVHTRKVAILHHRNHNEHPGAISFAERNERKRASAILFKNQYALYYKKTIPRIFWERVIARVIVRIIFGLKSLAGYNWLDWENLLYARTVSLLDFWNNRKRPYYLDQTISKK